MNHIDLMESIPVCTRTVNSSFTVLDLYPIDTKTDFIKSGGAIE